MIKYKPLQKTLHNNEITELRTLYQARSQAVPKRPEFWKNSQNIC